MSDTVVSAELYSGECHSSEFHSKCHSAGVILLTFLMMTVILKSVRCRSSLCHLAECHSEQCCGTIITHICKMIRSVAKLNLESNKSFVLPSNRSPQIFQNLFFFVAAVDEK